MIALGQIDGSLKSDEERLKQHISLIREASENGAKVIFFPELSLTGYTTTDASQVAIDLSDRRLSLLHDLSKKLKIIIGVGIPLKQAGGISITMYIIQVDLPPIVYSKNILHSDEDPYFIPGKERAIINLGNEKIGIGICYESSQSVHFIKLIKQGMTMYLASSAKTVDGMNRAIGFYKKAARENKIPVLAVNSVGLQDGFIAGGRSCVIDNNGIITTQASYDAPELVLYNR